MILTRTDMMVAKNSFQGKFLRVLCICSAGVLRSPTAAEILSREPFNFNTRACGIISSALVPLSPVLCAWAEEVVCFENAHADAFEHMFNKLFPDDTLPMIHIVRTEDNFDFRDPKLVKHLSTQLTECFL